MSGFLFGIISLTASQVLSGSDRNAIWFSQDVYVSFSRDYFDKEEDHETAFLPALPGSIWT